MYTFSTLYKKTRYTILKKSWPEVRTGVINTDWQRLLRTDCNLSLLLGENNLDHNHHASLDLLRQHIEQDVQITSRDIGAIMADVNDSAKDAYRKVSFFSFNIDRAASLKVLYHLYFVYQRGAQGIWIFAPPESVGKWPFSYSKHRQVLVPQLNAQDEYYCQETRNTITDAAIEALNWCVSANTCSRARKEQLIRDWFIGDDALRDTPDLMNSYVNKVNSSLNKMIAVLNANTLVFSQHSDFEKVREQDTAAFVYLYEKLDVIYLKNKQRSIQDLHIYHTLVLTIVHEVSHRALLTDDHGYQDRGLKPDARRFTSRKAFDNADSWAFFITDASNNLIPLVKNRVHVNRHG